MAKLVDSDALGKVQQALGITGRGAQETELTDGILEQVIDVARMVRRGRTISPSEGIFYGVFENTHVGAGTVNAVINPYRPELALNTPPYPAVVPPQFDIWLLYASAVRTTGTGVGCALLDVQYSGQTQGWGVDQAGAAVVQVPRIPLVSWDKTVTCGYDFLCHGAENQPVVKLGYRFPRIGTPDLTFRSTVDAEAIIHCTVVLGLFPVSLGQDAMVGGL